MMSRIIELSDFECRMISIFAEETAKTQQAIEFGQKKSKPRGVKEIARDTQIGKIAEVGVAKMLKSDFGLHLPINYEIYPAGECDDNDITINNWTIDIKSTRNGKWLLFERSKMAYRQRSGTLPDMIIMCKTPWDEDTDSPKGKSVELVGCVGTQRLIKGGRGVHRIKAGDCLPGTKCRLLSDNYAVRFDDLDGVDSLKDYVAYMLKHEPRRQNGSKNQV